MQTKLTAELAKTRQGQEADAILRSCVHCGFCTATCPTYQLLGDERDGPRGRIYLIKQVLEGAEPTRETQLHLDRCLTCRACETTCPSGVQYGRLADIGREHIEEKVSRPFSETLLRKILLHTVPYPKRIGTLIKAGNLFRPLLPAALKDKLAPVTKAGPWPTAKHQRSMLVLAGCVQSVSTPSTNQAAATVLDRLGITLLQAPEAGCCGALSHHLSAAEQTRQHIKQNIDAWWPYIEQGAEAIIITASGCGTMVKEYGHLLRDDAEYADKAARVSALAKDIVEVMQAEIADGNWSNLGHSQSIAFQCPCTLQHGQQLAGQVENLLQRVGFVLTPVQDAHLCCGSAGTYSILQPKLSQQLRANKLKALHAGKPERIVSANIGCQMHLSEADDPIVHWIELIAEKLPDA
ncbi:glycolate oxidase subunit GlcF [Methylophaga sp. OBS4]|uniref:glycolate oxidase subunit GlcF n=1 Tax=Methylophaga sp. OBS4 TaxID=2991935 RepID=UPI00225BB2AE|nr:glycolate oxidase subunit GlcF [Methylophaga sp. OBS4]MCX4187252.1 glycolate oxidase subunit GlcF [Methylophaga sp. OBS4]